MSEDARKAGLSYGLGIRSRLTLWFAAGAAGSVLLGIAVVYMSGLASIQGTLGQTYCQIASRTADQFENHFVQLGTVIRGVATDALTTEVVMEIDETYRQHGEEWIRLRRARLEEEWQSVGEEERLDLLRPHLSHRLRVLAGLEESLESILVYDTAGVLVAASNVMAPRSAIGSGWHDSTAEQERHFTYVNLDRANDRLTIVVPIWGGVDIVGYTVGVYDFRLFVRDVEAVRFGTTGEAVLVDYAGVPLRGQPRASLINVMGSSPPERQPVEATPSGPYWVAHSEINNWAPWQRLSCVAPLPLINSMRERFKLPPWSLIVTQSPTESYEALRNSLGNMARGGAFLVLVVGIVGAFAAWHISAPLKELQMGVRRFARGERDSRVTVSTRDEIAELAEEFNRMADRVTETEKELRAFAMAVENAADAIVMTDPKGTIYYVNPAFEKVTGYQSGEVKGKTPSVLRSPETPDRVYAEMWGALENGMAWRGELWNRRKTGEAYPVDLSISPIRDEGGKSVALLGVHRDISLARRYQESLEQEVEARTREIRETEGLTAMGRMASMIAHDLRNALSTVKMTLQILSRRHAGTGAAEEEHCEMGLGQVGYMEEILRDMLSYARPERLQSDWWNADKLIEGALASTAHSIEGKKIDVRFDGAPELPNVFCDRVKIQQVIQNLIENAVQAMTESQKLTIGTNLVLGNEEPVVRVMIEDEGVGISEDILPEIFDPFFTTRTKGSGLGLAIVKRIVEQHGGSINLSTQHGKGTRISFTLPTVPPQA